MLRMLIVLFAYGVGALWGLTHIVRAYCLLAWNDIFRPAEWARNYGILTNDRFPSHKFCWAIFGFAAFLRPWQKRWNVGATAIFGLLVWMWICAFFSPYPDLAYAQAIKASKYFVPALLVSVALVDREKQLAVLAVLCFSVGVWLAWAGLHAAVIQGNIEILMHIPGGQMTDRNDFLTAGTACLPLLGFFGWHYSGPYSRQLRFAFKGMLIASALAFVTSHSRGALVGLCGLGLFYAAFTGKFLKRFAVVCVLGIFLVLVTPQSTWERMMTIKVGENQTEMSARNRVTHMKTAVDVTFDKPIFGVGPASFPDESMKYGPFTADPHSIWLKCSSEYGLVGLFGFLLVIFVLSKKLLRIARRARVEEDAETEAMATALCCSFIGFVATGTFTSQFLSEYLWSIFGLAGAFIAFEELKFRNRAAPGAGARAKAPAAAPAARSPAST